MAVTVFDADVLIGFLNRSDAHHERATGVVRATLASGSRRVISAVNYSEVLVGPLRRGHGDIVRRMFDRLAIEVLAVDASLAARAAAVRAERGVTLADAYVLATALALESRDGPAVRLETFDHRVRRVHRSMRP